MILRARKRRLNNPQPSNPYDNGGGAAPILGGMPDKGTTQPLFAGTTQPLFAQRPPELQNQAIVQGPSELQNQAIVQGPPELQGQAIAQGPLELHNQAIPQLHSQHGLTELSGAPSSAPPLQHLQGQWQFQPQMQEMWAPVVPPNSNPQGSHSA